MPLTALMITPATPGLGGVDNEPSKAPEEEPEKGHVQDPIPHFLQGKRFDSTIASSCAIREATHFPVWKATQT